MGCVVSSSDDEGSGKEFDVSDGSRRLVLVFQELTCATPRKTNMEAVTRTRIEVVGVIPRRKTAKVYYNIIKNTHLFSKQCKC